MGDGLHHTTLDSLETNSEKPGKRWEASPALGIEAFNVNVAILERDERLSKNHFHYHEHQKELFYVVSGSCRVETEEASLTIGPDEFVSFDEGEKGAHLLYNPFDEPCKLVGIGWPQDGRYPVHQLKTTAEVLASNDGPTPDDDHE